ncbi:MAG: flagellar assembly protein FliH [Peptococcaceae bacterium]|nr:flagellar assembly protein FliH [Peptococcaceae bacterium]
MKNAWVDNELPRLIDLTDWDFDFNLPKSPLIPEAEESEVEVKREVKKELSQEKEAIAQLEGLREEGLAKANKMADQIVAQAESDAAILLQEAREKADLLLQQARDEAEQLREQVREQARQEFYPQFQELGYQDGLQAVQEELQGTLRQAGQALALAQRTVEVEFAQKDEVLLHLARKMAERILRAALEVEPARILQIVRTLCLMPQERTGWQMHVAPADAPVLSEITASGYLVADWVVDEKLQSGDCYLVCHEGLFDARMETQLDRLEQELKEELRKEALSDGIVVATQ